MAHAVSVRRPPVVFTLASGILLIMACDLGVSGPDDRSSAGIEHRPADRIQPYPGNPFYWQYRGRPVLLLGGSDQDNLFNHPNLRGRGLEAHLDLLVRAGGNYVRNTMSSRDAGNVWPHAPIGGGRYDLDEWNPEYWRRLDRFLGMTATRDILVQIEIWDRFDFARQPWDVNPFNPRNNVNYTASESRLPTTISSHPADRENPFFRSTPRQEDNRIVLGHQHAFVEKLLSVTLPYPHVLYTISNETNESPIWSAYWADFIRERAAEAGYAVHVTEMWDAWDLNHPMHNHTIDDPGRYSFLDLSQNSHQVGQRNWDNAQRVRSRIAGRPRPMNSVKIYGGPTYGGGYEEGTRKFWRNIFGGFASSRFHRPTIGLGLNETAQAHLRSMRMLTSELDVFRAEPRNDLLSSRSSDEAYAMARVGRQYAVYFPDRGSVVLDLRAAPGTLTVRWLDILGSRWSSETTVDGGGSLRLDPPGGGPWAVLLTTRTGS